MKRLIATTEGENKLGLRELLQRYVDDQWTADHYTDEQRAEILLDQFKRAILSELELLDLKPANDSQSNTEPDKI